MKTLVDTSSSTPSSDSVGDNNNNNNNDNNEQLNNNNNNSVVASNISNDDNNNKKNTTKSLWIQFNHAGASPSPPCVVQRVMQHLELEQEMGGYQAASMVHEELRQVYEWIGHRLLNCRTPSMEIALVESATVAWTRLFYSMVTTTLSSTLNNYNQQRQRQRPTKHVILVSQVEYAANIVACCHWIQQQHENNQRDDWTIICIPSKLDTNNPYNQNTGIVDVLALQDMLHGRFVLNQDSLNNSNNSNINNNNNNSPRYLDPASIALVCITHVPTNSGVINPVYEIGDMIANYNNNNYNNHEEQQPTSSSSSTLPQILYLVDACQSIGQMPIDVQRMKCHGLTGTGRKFLRGPRGTGFLYVSQDIVNVLIPHQVDHASATLTISGNSNRSSAMATTTPVEQLIHFTYRPGAARFEFWECNVANRLGLGRAVQFAMDQSLSGGGMEMIQRTIQSLARALQIKLLQHYHYHQEHKIHVHHPILCHDRNDNAPMDETTYSCCGIVAFWVDGISARTLQKALLHADSSSSSLSFVVGISPTTSTPLDTRIVLVVGNDDNHHQQQQHQFCLPEELIRVALSYTNSMDEIEAFCQKLFAIIDIRTDGVDRPSPVRSEQVTS